MVEHRDSILGIGDEEVQFRAGRPVATGLTANVQACVGENAPGLRARTLGRAYANERPMRPDFVMMQSAEFHIRLQRESVSPELPPPNTAARHWERRDDLDRFDPVPLQCANRDLGVRDEKVKRGRSVDRALAQRLRPISSEARRSFDLVVRRCDLDHAHGHPTLRTAGP